MQLNHDQPMSFYSWQQRTISCSSALESRRILYIDYVLVQPGFSSSLMHVV